MTTTAKPLHQGRRQSREFQQDVALLLRDWGFQEAGPAPRLDVKKPGPVTVADSGDIVGVPGWTLTAKSRIGSDLSTALNEADAARPVGVHRSAAIRARRGHDTKDAYVLMTFRQFADILAELEGLPGPKWSTRLRNGWH